MAYARKFDGSERCRLDRTATDSTGGLEKEAGQERLRELGAEFSELEDLLYYAGQNSLLLVLQGRDTSGKDGAIRTLLSFSNAQNLRVESFKVPSEEEMGHDFLWRIHSRAPRRGAITIFNRSHYEDVLVVRVHDLVPEKVWRARYRHIRHFEELLQDSGTIILKFLLHISKSEQEERLLDRERETEKAWKLAVGDWQERERWDSYTQAYEDAVHECATPAAPWFVVPADHKWFRDLAILEQVVAALRPRRADWMQALDEVGKRAKEELEAYRKQKRRPEG